jgi:hypothetical protein
MKIIKNKEDFAEQFPDLLAPSWGYPFVVYRGRVLRVKIGNNRVNSENSQENIENTQENYEITPNGIRDKKQQPDAKLENLFELINIIPSELQFVNLCDKAEYLIATLMKISGIILMDSNASSKLKEIVKNL